MKKTIFLSEYKVINNVDNQYVAPYIFFHAGKWREDSWYFNSMPEIKHKAKEQGFLIK